jgi:hypothetical protein
MGSKSGSAPAAPNPGMMAQQQTQSNMQTAAANSYLNAINQTTPYGSLKWNQTGTRQIGDGHGGFNELPEWSVSTELTPQQQKIVDAQQAATLGTSELARDYTSRIRDATAQPFTTNGMPQVAALPDAPTYDKDYRQHAYETILQRAQPQQEADQRALQQRLADQGVGLNDPGYQSAMRAYSSGLNDFRLGADLNAQQSASQDFNTATQGFQNQVQRRGLTVDDRNRAIQEALMVRNQPINEVSTLLGAGTGVQMPQFQNTQQQPIAPTDTMGPQMMAYQAQQNAYNQQLQQSNAAMGGLAGLAGTLGGFALGGPMGGMLGGAAGRSAGGLFGLGR